MFIDDTELQFIYDADACVSFYFCCEKCMKIVDLPEESFEKPSLKIYLWNWTVKTYTQPTAKRCKRLRTCQRLLASSLKEKCEKTVWIVGVDSMEHDHTSTRKGLPHVAMMLIFCVVLIAAVILLSFIGFESTYLYLLFVLICPIMIFVMLIMDRRFRRRSYG